MPVTYINRQKKTYYLHQGVTKKGNPRYTFSQKSEGDLVEQIPEGYEIYENPHARVFLRQIRPQLITPTEVEIVDQGMKRFSDIKYYQLEVKKDTLSIFTPTQDVESFGELLRFSPLGQTMRLEDMLGEFLTYRSQMRFVLVDKKNRTFITERFCYFGSVDDWIDIGPTADLATLVEQYVKHLGKDSFYDLH